MATNPYGNPYGNPGGDPMQQQAFQVNPYGNPNGNPGGDPMQQPGQMQPFQVHQGFGDAPYRVNWSSFDRNNQAMPHKFQMMEPEKQQEKMQSAGEYVGVLQENQPWPATRGCKDVAFALLFFVTVGVMAFFLITNWGNVQDAFDDINSEVDAGGIKGVADLLLPLSSGAGGAMIACAAFVLLMRMAPACVVWTSLLLGPSLTIALGLAFIALLPENGLLIGGVLILSGCCSLFCIFFCWREFIPFTIQLAETLAIVMQQNPCTIFVAILGGIVGLFWPFFCIVTLIAVNVSPNSEALRIGFIFVLLWGGFIASYWTHTMMCGIYGRWYYAKDKGSEVMASIKTSTTSSFGSICMGAFIIASIRTLEILLKQAENQAREEGNAAVMVAVCVLRCCVSCIGDIVEYISEWAYVQVAVRGTSFCDSAKCTYALLTFGNMQFILSDLLIDSVGLMATLMCFAAGLGLGILGNAQNWDDDNGMAVGAALGLIPAIMISSAAGNVITAGSKTILSSWAENPDALAEHRPDLHRAFHEKMVYKFNEPTEQQS